MPVSVFLLPISGLPARRGVVAAVREPPPPGRRRRGGGDGPQPRQSGARRGGRNSDAAGASTGDSVRRSDAAGGISLRRRPSFRRLALGAPSIEARERDDELLLAGIETTRVTGARLDREPDQVIDAIRRHLARRAGGRG